MYKNQNSVIYSSFITESIMKLLISFSLFLFLNFSFVVSNDNSTKLTFKVEPIGFHHSILGEGPHWDEKKQVLYHVDINGGAVWKIDLKNNKSESVHLGDLVSLVIPFADGDDLLVSRRNKIGRLNWASKNFTVIAEVAPELKGKERFNDGKVDAKGRLWIGTILDGKNGVVVGGGGFYRLDHNNFTKVSGNFTITNGMGWSRDNKKLYLNDSQDRKTWVFDFDLEKGTISEIKKFEIKINFFVLGNKRILVDSTKHPSFQKGWDQDGMTIDQNGKIWTSLYGGGRVFQINPENGM